MSNMSRRKGDNYERDYAKYCIAFGIAGARRAKRGNNSGDVHTSPEFVSECKNARTWRLGEWVDQMQEEKRSCGARFGAVIAKRPKKSNVGEHYFIMTVEDGLRLLAQAGVIEVGDAPTG